MTGKCKIAFLIIKFFTIVCNAKKEKKKKKKGAGVHIIDSNHCQKPKVEAPSICFSLFTSTL